MRYGVFRHAFLPYLMRIFSRRGTCWLMGLGVGRGVWLVVENEEGIKT
jgi:hypothetical protein